MLKYRRSIIASILILAIAIPCFSSCNGSEPAVIEGKSAYELAVEQGFEGTLDEWLKSLEAKSAYDLAVEQGFKGTLDEWLKSLEAKSAYELAVEQGFEGTLEEYMALLNPHTVTVNLGNLFDNNFCERLSVALLLSITLLGLVLEDNNLLRLTFTN